MRTDLNELLRHLRRSPTSAAAAVFTLAVTLGAVATVFAVVHAVALTPPPFESPDRLVTLGETPTDAPGPPRMVGVATFEAWRTRARSLATLAAFDPTNVTVTGFGPAERVSATDVDPEFMRTLGVAPQLGRSFISPDIGQPVVIVSHGFWIRKLGSDPAIVGTTIVVGGRVHTVIGVMPARFRFPLNPSELWRPLPLTFAQVARTGFRMRAIARLSPGVTAAALEQALDEVSRRSVPASRVVATPFATAIARGSTRAVVLVAAAAALAMFIAFANLAGLLMVRSLDRARELSVRVALGASRVALARHVMLEAQALVLFGAAGGVLLALWLTPAAGRLVLEQFGDVANREIAVDWFVVALVVAVAVTGAAFCGLVPAVLAASRAGAEGLRRGATRPPRELALRRILIAAEVALAFVLLVSMALVGRGFVRLLEIDPGFAADGVQTMRVSLPAARYNGNPEQVAFYTSLQSRLTERLGAGTSAIVDELPLTGDAGRSLVGVDRARADSEAVVRTVGDNYFQVMGIAVGAGRALDSRDTASVAPRAVVSRSLATRVFAGRAAVGRRIWLAGPRRFVDIVGVVEDVRHRALDEAPIESVYLATWQEPSRSSHIVVRAGRPAAEVIATVREEVARLDPDLPVYAPRPMDEVVAASAGMSTRRILTGAFTAFAVLALALSAVGLFGVVAHDVASRRSELAVRAALGATPARLVVATLRQGATLVGAGIAAGVLLSVWSGPLLAALAPVPADAGLSSAVAAGALLLTVGICAALPASRRAARADPLTALRSN